MGLFPVETQNRILGLPSTPAEEKEAAAKYVSSSSFRRVERLAVLPLPHRQLQPPALPSHPNALNTENLEKADMERGSGVPSRQLTPPSLPPVRSFDTDVLPLDNSLR